MVAHSRSGVGRGLLSFFPHKTAARIDKTHSGQPPEWVFLRPSVLENALKQPFDIPGDLDTPVSAFMKLGAFAPHFLLESVEGGERLGRYSFIGFGEALSVRLTQEGLQIGAERRPVPRSAAELLEGLRSALGRTVVPGPELPGVPLAGGLVGYAAYDVVRFF